MTDKDLGRAVRLVALLNLAYFGVEFAVALRIGSVSLLADRLNMSNCSQRWSWLRPSREIASAIEVRPAKGLYVYTLSRVPAGK